MAERKNNDRKSRQNEDFDFVEPTEQRKHRRVGSSALDGIPVVLKPAPPFFGEPIPGKMIDLSGGGTAVILKDAIPVNSKMKIWIAFPDRGELACLVSVRRVSPANGGYLTGLQFLDISEDMAAELAQMSADYDLCEKRIAMDESPACGPCAFSPLCDKPQKMKKAA